MVEINGTPYPFLSLITPPEGKTLEQTLKAFTSSVSVTPKNHLVLAMSGGKREWNIPVVLEDCGLGRSFWLTCFVSQYRKKWHVTARRWWQHSMEREQFSGAGRQSVAHQTAGLMTSFGEDIKSKASLLIYTAFE
eukprot:Hpha_TRINITY_DN15941_c3_g1::TRINITY_DN15941_c3_g1_i15::g.71795::m.71795